MVIRGRFIYLVSFGLRILFYPVPYQEGDDHLSLSYSFAYVFLEYYVIFYYFLISFKNFNQWEDTIAFLEIIFQIIYIINAYWNSYF